MINSIKQKAKKIFGHNNNFSKFSFSQTGEDLIINFIFEQIGITTPSYVDIGAHHPFYLSNTAFFYNNGSTGINIEPDKNLFDLFIKEREKDINLNIGISDSESELDFYLMNQPALNTFSKEEADKYVNNDGFIIKNKVKVQVKPINKIVDEYNKGIYPDFLTLDAEGIDEIVIKSIDYDSNPPIVICIETISFSMSGRGTKNVELIEFIKSKGYILFADTYHNSIFVRENHWIKK